MGGWFSVGCGWLVGQAVPEIEETPGVSNQGFPWGREAAEHSFQPDSI